MRNLHCNTCGTPSTGNLGMVVHCDNCGKLSADAEGFTFVEIRVKGKSDGRDYCAECFPKVKSLLNL